MEMPYKYIQQGWQCPVCGKVHAPWASECDCHEIIVKATTNSSVKVPDQMVDEIAMQFTPDFEKAFEEMKGE